jgi:Spy/CpxP family protein refolding chaperone
MSLKTTLAAAACAAVIPLAVHASPGDDDWPSRAERMDRLSQRLDLSEEQRTRMEALFDEHRAQREVMRERMRARMAEVLTSEQRERMEEMRSQHREKRREGRHHRGGRHCDDERGERS